MRNADSEENEFQRLNQARGMWE